MFHYSLSRFLIFLFFMQLVLFQGVTNGQSELLPEREFYPNPGIVAYRDGKWVGSDHLYNLTNRIDIVVEIFKPENERIPVTEGMIRARITDIFSRARIIPQAQGIAGKPLLPFFHLLIMIYPIEEEGYAACCEGRLFEQVYLDRVKMDEQAVMQAITWESSSLILTPADELTNQLYKTVDEIANTFVDRFLFYEDIRTQIQRDQLR